MSGIESISLSPEAQAAADAQAEVDSPAGRRLTARAVEHAIRSDEAVARYRRGEMRAKAFAKARSEARDKAIVEARRKR